MFFYGITIFFRYSGRVSFSPGTAGNTPRRYNACHTSSLSSDFNFADSSHISSGLSFRNASILQRSLFIRLLSIFLRICDLTQISLLGKIKGAYIFFFCSRKVTTTGALRIKKPPERLFVCPVNVRFYSYSSIVSHFCEVRSVSRLVLSKVS